MCISSRSSNPPPKYNPSTGGSYLQALRRIEKVHNLQVNDILGCRAEEYSLDTGKVISRYIYHLCNEIARKETSHATQYMLNKSLKLFGEKGVVASKAELNQTNQKVCLVPELVKNLSEVENRRVMRDLIILTQKRDGIKKGRLAYNGKPTRTCISREESSSRTTNQVGIFLTSTIDAYERRDIMSVDIPNTYIQVNLPVAEKGQDRIKMKVTGLLVDWLVEIEPETYEKFFVMENRIK